MQRVEIRQRLDVAEAERAQVRQAQRPLPRDVAERVAAGVAVLGGIGHLADADAIEHDPDDAIEMPSHCFARLANARR